MSLAQREKNLAAPRKRGEECSVCALMKQLSKADLKVFEGWLRSNARYSNIAKELKEDGHRSADGLPIDGQTISRHARGGCARREVYRA